MPATMQSLGIDHLSRDERLALVMDIWDSILAEPGPPMMSEAQRQEIERRVAEDDADPDDLVPWEQVKAQASARLKKSR